MCLFATSRVKTAKRDIVCYKTLYVATTVKNRPGLYSIQRNFNYELNVLYECKGFDKDLRYGSTGYQGFHSYNIHPDSGRITVKCIIPKGSLYYTGEYGQRMSNKIIVKELVKGSEAPTLESINIQIKDLKRKIYETEIEKNFLVSLITKTSKNVSNSKRTVKNRK